jgi:hypothetical protein
MFGIAVYLFVFILAAWLNWPPPLYRGSVNDFLTLKEKEFTDSDGAEFIGDYDGNRVDWRFKVASVNEARKYYLVQPEQGVTNQRIAVYPDDFEQGIDTSRIWRVRALIDKIGDNQIILKNARLD